ncbi:MAG TPA: glycerophosphodiester phosphodiesterase [Clostridia bacterium]|nr:glycerophosphodiester phosphodiesterase [Clostridia bacterium]
MNTRYENPGGRPLLLGHRGCRRCAPENTFEAFDLALQHGCDGFEFDVRRTADGRNVICHDSKFGKLLVASSTFDLLSEDIARPVRSLFRNSAQQQTFLPCFEQVLERYAQRAFLDIELKVAGVEDAVVGLLHEQGDYERVVVSSFLPEVVERVHALDPNVPSGYIFSNARAMRRWRSLPVTHVMPHCTLVTEKLVRDFHSAGKQVLVWTVNAPRDMQRMTQFGVDGIISDDTQLLSRTVRGQS